MYGVVVTPPLNESEIMYVVYIDNTMPLLFVRRLPPTDYSRLSKKERKELEKAEREKELSFGDWIEFETEDVRGGCIEAYSKMYPLNPSRCNGEHLQIETVCVFSNPLSTRGHQCFSELFGPVRVTADAAACYLPDVAYKCWVSVEVSRISSLTLELGEFVDVAEDQTLVAQATWNQNDPRFISCVEIETSDEEDETDEDDDKSKEPTHPFEIHEAKGILVGDRMVYCDRFPDVKILLAYVKPVRRTQVGNWIQFSAYYCIQLRAYVIRSYRRQDCKSFPSEPYKFGSQHLIGVDVKWEKGLPMGFLWSKDKQLGLVHDSDGVLLPALLGKNPYAPMSVFVVDTGISRLSRFQVKYLSDMTASKVNAVANSGYPDILDDGLFLGDNSVLSPNYLCVKIRFDDNSQEGWDKLQPGMWIKFKAYSPKGQPDFRIKAWSQNTSPHSSPVLAVETFTGYVFEARGTYEGVLGALKSPVFGFIEIPSEKRAQMKPKAKGVSVVWVREGRANAKTRFVLHSVEKPSHDDEQEAAGGNLFRNPMNELLKHKAAAEVIVPCKRSNCRGRDLLQRCMNNRNALNALMAAEDDSLFMDIMKILDREDGDI